MIDITGLKEFMALINVGINIIPLLVFLCVSFAFLELSWGYMGRCVIHYNFSHLNNGKLAMDITFQNRTSEF